jgi:hypothetical protein
MSEDEVAKTRLQRLEADVQDLRETQGKIFDMLREVRDAQIRTGEREKLHSCPSPGLCVRLQTQVDVLERQQQEHEQYVQQAKGAGVLTKWLWSIFGVAGLIAAVKAVFFAGK